MINVIIISGERGEGKTTFLKKMIKELRKRKMSLHGFYADNIKDYLGKEGYELHNVSDNSSLLLCKRDSSETGRLHLQDFWFNKQSIENGEKWLIEGFNKNNPVYILDEAGKFELDGYVWDKVLKQILKKENGTLIITVRNKFVDRIIDNYNLDNHNTTVVTDLLFTVELTNKIER